ncbi:MAG TPA: hypothetical protein DCY03_05350 [Planctomycetaceae bacterium]|nr:hypothetical protein [Planctomycetaceae bacterium]
MTTESSLNKLLKWVENPDWISNLNIKNVSAILDERDDESFSMRWMEAFRSIEEKKITLHAQNENLVLKIREIVYLQIFNCWKSPDLAAYVSDDFGLIGDALLLDSSDSWINGLFQAYVLHNIPVGNFEKIEGKLSDLVL